MEKLINQQYWITMKLFSMPNLNLLLGLLFSFSGLVLEAQVVTDFEDILIPDEYLDGSDGAGGFTSGSLFLPNDYNPDFQSFRGWAISKDTDVTTQSFMNQFSAITGEGYNGSSNYAVAYAFDPVALYLEEDAAGAPVEGLYLTNSTYGYLTMLNGDGFAKKFGGVTGNDPDFFLLTVKKFLDGNLVEDDSIDFYLADFRFSDNNQDYIIDEWTYLDLSSLGDADSLQFSLSSSDSGIFGMNNPAYFCIDNVTTAGETSVFGFVRSSLEIETFPNPATDLINIKTSNSDQSLLSVFNTQGQMVLQRVLAQPTSSLPVADWPRGTYFLEVRDSKGARGIKRVVLK
jgi:hypothetical protein